MNVYSIHNPIIGTRLFQLALEWAETPELPGSQRSREAVIARIKRRKKIINGSRSARAAREAVEAAVADLRAARDARKQRHIGKRHGTPKPYNAQVTEPERSEGPVD